MQVAQGQADIAGLSFSKSVYPYTVKGAPIDMCFREGRHLRRHQLLTLVKNAPDRELGIAFINHMLDPAVQQGLAEATLTAPTISGLEFKPDVAKYMAYPETRWTRWAFSARTGPSSIRSGRSCWRSTTRSSAHEAGSNTAASVRLQELTKLFGATRAVDRVSLTIEPGSMVALLGPSGCGKTTTLRMIAGLVAAECRRHPARRPVDHACAGASPQYRHAVPELRAVSAYDGRREHRLRPGDARRQARRRRRSASPTRCSWCSLPDFGDRMPAQLSGGQQQRVALARALVVEPAVLLLDEPLGALDKACARACRSSCAHLQRRLGITTVMVTHDQDEALTMADRIVIMRDGRIEQAGTPAEIYQRPVSRFVAGFLGASNFLRGRVVDAANGVCSSMYRRVRSCRSRPHDRSEAR